VNRLGYQPALDGVRAIAIGGVIGIHYFRAPRAGYLGVDLFFVLSGFLITTLLLGEREHAGAIDLRAFWIRRARRLLPALLVIFWVYLWLDLGVSLLVHSPAPFIGQLEQTVIGGLYVGNFVSAWNPHALHFQVLWSLALEEQFYLLWPIALVVVLRHRARPQRIITGLLVAAAVVWAWRVGLWLSGAPVKRLYYTPDVASDSILLGCAAGVAFVHGYAASRIRLFATPALIAVLLYLVAGPARLPGSVELAGWPLWKTFFAAACALAISGIAYGSGCARFLSARPLVFVGKISYGLYLWHTVFLTLLPAWAALGATVAAATASYVWIEKRFRGSHASRRVRGPSMSKRLRGVGAPGIEPGTSRV
jgi:peptidoglycan/LPS O-acetylase OafA/YrhL